MFHLPSTLYKEIFLHEHISKDSIDLLSNGQFCFKTVAHKPVLNDPNRSKIPTPACRCSYIHEYFSYITKDGDMIQDELDQLYSWFDAGECPHVSLSCHERHDVVMTSISALHLAVVADNSFVFDIYKEQIYPCSPDAHWILPSGIFKLTPAHTAVQKQRYTYLEYGILPSCESVKPYIQNQVLEKMCFIEKLNNSEDEQFYMDVNFTLCVCVNMGNIQMLHLVLNYDPEPSHLNSAIGCACYSEVRFMKALLEHSLRRKSLTENNADPTCITTNPSDKICVDKTVMYAATGDNFEMLKLLEEKKVLSNSLALTGVELQPQLDRAYQLAVALEHRRCSDILRNHVNFTKLDRQPLDGNIFEMVLLLKVREGYSMVNSIQCGYLLRRLCERGYDINRKNHKGKTVLMLMTTYQLPEMLEELIQHGSDINVTDNDDKTVLRHLLECALSLYKYTYTYMHCLQYLLYNNPTVRFPDAIERSYLGKALRLDSVLIKYGKMATKNTVKFQLNIPSVSLQHCVTPLLWKCGIPLSSKLENEQNIPDLLREFMIQVMTQPRSLKMACRNVLRRHFPGRLLHDFLEVICCPTRIKDYILISELLNYRSSRDSPDVQHDPLV